MAACPEQALASRGTKRIEMKQPVLFREFEVREAPGIGAGLEPLRDFCPGINVLYGPNGSGKSTTLRLMQSCLVLRAKEGSLRHKGDRAEGTIQIGDSSAHITLRDQDAPEVLGPVVEIGTELARDCRFSLRELLDAAGGSRYASLFLEAAAGGIDLIQIARSLGFEDRGRTRPTDRRQLQELRRKLNIAEQDAARFPALKSELQDLEKKRAELHKRSERLALLRDAERHKSGQAKAAQAKAALALFSPVLEKLDGSELEQFEAAESKIAGALGAIRESREKWHFHLRTKKATGVRHRSIVDSSSGHLIALETQKEQLSSFEERLGNLQADLARHQGRMAASATPGSAIGAEFPAGLDAEFLLRMESWCDRMEDLHGRMGALSELEGVLGPLAPVEAGTISAEIQRLRDWLAAERLDQQNRRNAIFPAVSAAILFLLCSALGFLVHPIAFSGCIAPLVLAFVAFQQRKKLAPACKAEIEQNSARHPSQWNPPAVNALIASLEQAHATNLEAGQKFLRWAGVLDSRRIEHDSSRRQLEAEAADFARIIGPTGLEGKKCFSILARSLHAREEARRDCEGIRAEIARVEKASDALRTQIKGVLDAIQFHTDGDSSDFSASTLARWLAEIRNRNQQFREATSGMDAAKAGILKSLSEIRESRRNLDVLAAKVTPQDSPSQASPGELRSLLAEHLRRLEQYHSSRRHADSFGQVEREAAAFFQLHRDLAASSLEAITEEINHSGNPNEELAQINQSLGNLKGRLEQTSQSHEVENSRMAYENLRASLVAERLKMLESLSGSLLAAGVQKKVAAESVPAVQRRAGELLRDFTGGQCELLVDGPALRVLQNGVRHSPSELEELSDGTRVQLLIAVRLAFVEQGEQGWRLPLFFDEAFANSDREREGRLMQTLARIASGGRQIFYFTSQVSEVARWQELLAEAAPGLHKFIPLRKAFAKPASTAAIRIPAAIPEPQPGESIRDYSGRIDAPLRIDPWTASEDEIPLALVLDDPRDLWRCLEAGVQCWGPLFRVGRDACGLADGPTAYDRAARRVSFLYSLCELWQMGRGRAVEREHLEAAGITNTAKVKRLDELWNHTLQRGREASVLCAALESKEISIQQLGPKLIADLRVYFEEHNILGAGTPLEAGEIILRARAHARQLGLTDEQACQMLTFFAL